MFKRSLNIIAAILASTVGHFGYQPPSVAPRDELDNYRPSKGRIGKRPSKGTSPRRFGIPKEFYGHQDVNSAVLYSAMNLASQRPMQSVVGSMRGSGWLRENRRRRSCGLPQLRRSTNSL